MDNGDVLVLDMVTDNRDVFDMSWTGHRQWNVLAMSSAGHGQWRRPGLGHR